MPVLQAEGRLIECLSRFLPYDNEDLMMASLRLLFNLSFDQNLRATIMNCGLVSGTFTLLQFLCDVLS
jgi:hypothetical protein